MATNDGLRSLVDAGVAPIEATIAKVTKKLEPTVTYILTYNGDLEFDDPERLPDNDDQSLGDIGGQTVADLESNFGKLLPFKSLIEAMVAHNKEGGSSVYLRAAKLRCEEAGLRLPSIVSLRILSRDVLQAVADESYDEAADILAAPNLESKEESSDVDKWTLRGMVENQAALKQLQEHLIQQVLDSVFSGAAAKGSLEGVGQFLEAVSPFSEKVLGVDMQGPSGQ